MERLFTRPLNFPTVQGYSESLAITLPQIIGFRFGHALLYSERGVMEVWRNSEESAVKLVPHIMRRIETGAFDFPSFAERYEASLRRINDRLREAGRIARQKDISGVQGFVKDWLFGAAGMVIVYWLSKQDVGATMIAQCRSLRERSEKMYYLANDFFQQQLDVIAEETGKDVQYLRQEEIIDYYGTGLLPDDLESREEGYGYLDNKLIKAGRDELKALVASKSIALVKEEAIDKKSLKGQTAFKGKVQGAAIIVKDPRNMTAHQGAVLIAPMTTPDYMAIIRKAAAIVTDEGGLLCHAAIVAREMHKPCVIGTKHATKIFKDGDMIEVDAENGVVKKVS